MAPRVSVVMPAHDAGAWVERAVRSVLEQTLQPVEVVAVENGSRDDTARRLAAMAEADARVRLLRTRRALGPGAARNLGLAAARGDWLALLDADDRFQPRRLQHLIAAAEAEGAALAADNQRLIHPDGTVAGTMWPRSKAPRRIDAAAFVRANRWGRRGFGLGYAKPLIRRDRIVASGLRYDPRLRVAEDFHFLLALLLRGDELLLLPEALYDYTLRPASVSRSLSQADLEAIVQAAREVEAGAPTRPVARALAAYRRSVARALAHRRVVTAIKAGQWGAAAGMVAARPRVVPLLFRYGAESVAKRLPRAQPGEAQAVSPPIAAYFGPDCTDSAVIRRIGSLRQEGLRVIGFTFRRRRFNRDYQPDWENVALGVARDADYRARAWALLRAIPRVAARRRRLRRAALFYARNLDLALLAVVARGISRSRAPLAYEVLDVRPALLGDGWRARLMRAAERVVLARAQLLVVSSPAFVREYFAPVQGYRGDWFLLENKIHGPQLRASTRRGDGRAAADLEGLRPGRLVIGWFGTLRCPRSLDMLAELCRALPGRVAVYLRGYPTETGLEPFLAEVERHPNMVYGGEFASPADLPDIYGAIDLAWCFDYLEPEGNSRWLLPNRLYDAGYFNVPALAETGTETGRVVEERGLGWTVAEPVVPNLTRLLGALDDALLARRREHIATLPRSLFCDEDDTGQLLRALMPAAPDTRKTPDVYPKGDLRKKALHPEGLQ